MSDTLACFIGFDAREEIAADVCRHSLLRESTIPLYVRMLKQEGLRHANLYWRQWTARGAQKIDSIDKRPFSTEFAFTRFLVPALMQYEGWALFCDCDFLFMADVAELLPLLDDSKAVLVAKQVHEPDSGLKMDGQAQSRYRRKNWSSFMLLNCGHRSVKDLTVHAVNNRTGQWLHGFEWLTDDQIGSVPPQWNWIDGVTLDRPKAVHYTAGGPWFKNHQSVAFAEEWRDAYARACRDAIKRAA